MSPRYRILCYLTIVKKVFLVALLITCIGNLCASLMCGSLETCERTSAKRRARWRRRVHTCARAACCRFRGAPDATAAARASVAARIARSRMGLACEPGGLQVKGGHCLSRSCAHRLGVHLGWREVDLERLQLGLLCLQKLHTVKNIVI